TGAFRRGARRPHPRRARAPGAPWPGPTPPGRPRPTCPWPRPADPAALGETVWADRTERLAGGEAGRLLVGPGGGGRPGCRAPPGDGGGGGGGGRGLGGPPLAVELAAPRLRGRGARDRRWGTLPPEDVARRRGVPPVLQAGVRAFLEEPHYAVMAT